MTWIQAYLYVQKDAKHNFGTFEDPIWAINHNWKTFLKSTKPIVLFVSNRTLEALGSGIGTGLVFCHSFSVSNNVNRLCLISLKIWNLDAAQDRITPHCERRTSYPWLAQPKNRGLYIVVKRFDQKIGTTLEMFSLQEFQGILVNHLQPCVLWITSDSGKDFSFI